MAAEPVMVMNRDHIQSESPFLPWAEAKGILRSGWRNARWFPRQQAEASDEWVQIIPCAVIQDRLGRYAVFHRLAENREDLSNKVSLVIGGHVEPDGDSHDGPWSLLLSTLRRELQEEVNVRSPSIEEPLGLLVDRRSIKASRHVALAYRVLTHEEIRVNATEEFQVESALSGTFLSMRTLRQRNLDYDPWSLLLLDVL